MIEVCCYLCGGSEAQILMRQNFKDPYLDLVDPNLNEIERCWKKCMNCGFIYRSPMLSESEQDLLYKKYGHDVFKKENPDAYFDRISSMSPEDSENFQKAVWLESEFRQNPHYIRGSDEMPVLDVGCGAGLLQHTMKSIFSNRLNLYGVELNSDYASLARRRAGIDVKQRDYEPNLFGRKFPLVICTKVLEHVRDPIDFVGKLASDLLDEGVLFIEVPDISDFERLPAEHDRFYIPHIYFFSKQSLGKIFSRCGLHLYSSRSVIVRSGRGYFQALGKKVKIK